MDKEIYTIGHSSHTLEYFFSLLTRHGIESVVDVRSAPYSKWQPQYNKASLEIELPKANIQYLFMGKELGGRGADKSCYRDGRVQFDLLAQSPLFREGLSRLIENLSHHKMVIMCAEQEPLDCHRTLLIGKALRESGIQIHHIHADGSIESQTDAMMRLLDKWKMPAVSLFESTEELIQQAYKRQEELIAYREP